MALNPISLDERFRPWFLAGVTHFLLPDNVTLEPQTDSRKFFTPPQNTGMRQALPPPAGKRPRGPLPSPAPQKAAPRKKTPAPAVIAASSDSWPEHWQAQLRKTPNAPVIWTYPELGADLSGNGDKTRSACLRGLINGAGLPKGSSAFWPLTLDSGWLSGSEETTGRADRLKNEHCADSRYFREGLHLLKPRALILFGPRSLVIGGLTLSASNPFTQTFFQGILHILLPEFIAILEDKNIFSKTSVYLRASLTTLPGIFK